MKRFFVVNEAVYAENGAGGAASTPDELAPGAVGIFGISNSTYKSLLTTNGAGLQADGIVIAVGTNSGGPLISQPLPASAATATRVASANAASVAQVTHVGYDGTGGSLSLPTIADGDWGEVKIIRSTYGINQRVDKDVFEVSNLTAGATPYEVAFGVVDSYNNRDSNTHFLGNMDILTNGTAGNFGTVETVAVVNGSTLLTVSAGDLLSVGDFVRIAGSTYQIAAKENGTSYTLDRPYAGATNAAVANADVKIMTSITEAGIAVTGVDPLVEFKVAVSGVLEDATIAYTTAAEVKAGDAKYLILPEEKKALAYTGYHDKLDTRVKTPETLTDLANSYDVIRLNVNPTLQARNEMNATFNTHYEVAVAFRYAGTQIASQNAFNTVLNAYFTNVSGLPTS